MKKKVFKPYNVQCYSSDMKMGQGISVVQKLYAPAASKCTGSTKNSELSPSLKQLSKLHKGFTLILHAVFTIKQ